ncbi:MAG: helix-turn-helix domain-containing protein [bacterium]
MEEKNLEFDEFLNTDEIAKVLKKNVATIQRWCREGELPAAKLGRTYMVRKRDFEEWFKTKMLSANFAEKSKKA